MTLAKHIFQSTSERDNDFKIEKLKIIFPNGIMVSSFISFTFFIELSLISVIVDSFCKKKSNKSLILRKIEGHRK